MLHNCLAKRILQKLDPVSERIRRVEATRPRNRIIPDDVVSGLGKEAAESVDLVDDESRVGLSLGLKLRIDTDVD